MIKKIQNLAFGEYIFIVLFGTALAVSKYAGFSLGTTAGHNFWTFFTEMIAILPLMFILVGLADEWLPREKVERHTGEKSGLAGIFWVLVLGMFQAGPLYGAFPVAYLLWEKGCSARNIFIYIGAFSTMKLPMLAFEISFLGLKFSLLRTLITLPVFIAIGFLMAMMFREQSFIMRQPE